MKGAAILVIHDIKKRYIRYIIVFAINYLYVYCKLSTLLINKQLTLNVEISE